LSSGIDLWLRNLSQAFTESAHALDFISLLLTKYAPKQAETSISPFLKGTLPLASLGAEVVQPAFISEAKRQNEKMASTGWKLQALNSAADSILKSATKLEEEMKQEARYWDQILAIKDKGWVISRMPRERHTLGVRLGFLESPTEFRERGVAAVRRGEDGAVELDLGANAGNNQVLRARVIRKNLTVADSTDGNNSMDDDSIDSAIIKARNNLFDSELFAELHREARGLSNWGVKCLGTRVNVPLGDDTILSIDLVDQSTGYSSVDSRNSNRNYQTLSKLVVNILRILLSQLHHQCCKQRAGEPIPISERRKSRPFPVLLRPLLSHMEHKDISRDLESNIQTLQMVLSNAGLDIQVGKSRNNVNLKKLLTLNRLKGSPNFVRTLIANLCGNLETAIPIKVSVPNSSDGHSASQIIPSEFLFTILARTHAMGTGYKILLGSTAHERSRVLFQEKWFSTATELMVAASNTIQVYLVQILEARSGGQLRTMSPQIGDLSTSAQNGKYHTLQIRVNPDRFTIRHAVVDEEVSHNYRVVEEWTPDSQRAVEGRGWNWIVEQAIQGHL
jgi:hypothetical protein